MMGYAREGDNSRRDTAAGKNEQGPTATLAFLAFLAIQNL